jgi:hypothetical protein
LHAIAFLRMIGQTISRYRIVEKLGEAVTLGV